jgi:uncharacterized spore protein YtfJ
MNLEQAVKEFGSKLAEEVDVRAVFGDPLKLGGHVVVPVAAVRILLSAEKGGRADLSATPVGFLCAEGSRVVFKAIEARGPKPRRRRR